MIYKSDNGYTGIMEKGNFMGFKHWDLTILGSDGHVKYHATLQKALSHADFKREIDDFPETLEVLHDMYRGRDDEEDDDGEE